MKFRTEVAIKSATNQRVSLEDKVFSIGSCFATEIATMLNDGQLQTLNNPFGTVFNPYSINNAIQRLYRPHFYDERDIVEYHNRYISLDHHTSFDTESLHHTLEKINTKIEEGHNYLKETKWVIITYGTAFVYEFLPQNRLIANCHKLPSKFFSKRLLTHTELINAIRETIHCLKKMCENGVQILFSVSPVRHTKDGTEENMHSKAKLITAIHEAIAPEEICHYLPIYEIMMDDLRDYRFYKEDMIHPNDQAIKYIFEKFRMAYFTSETNNFIDENLKIKQALQHRPSDENSETHKVFLQKIKERIALQQNKVKHTIFRN